MGPSPSNSPTMTSTEFLRACLRLRHSPDAHEALQALVHRLDGRWESLQPLIAAERLGPLLHRVVRAHGIAPPAVAAALRESYLTTGLQNMLLWRELGHGLHQLAATGVAAIVLKGAALAETVYGNPALRPMIDVDLLVHRRDLDAARRVFEGLGYVLERAETHPGALAEHESELALRKPGPVAAAVDLHWSLFDSPYYQHRIAMDWFWETAGTASIAGAPTLVLGPEALLIHLCGHLALHHGGKGLLWWHDVVEVLVWYRGRIDWPELLSRVEWYDLLLPVRTVLTGAAEEWGAPVPDAVLRALCAQVPSPRERRVFADLGAAQRSAGQRFWSDLVAIPDWRQRLRFARTNLVPSAAYMRQRYRIAHPLLLPFYYPYRWLRGLRGDR